jgi:acylphosphatase
MKKTVFIYYRGRVQGVGFRFTCQRVAENHGIAGWVKNMPDGSVRLAAQGDERSIKKFLSEIEQNLNRFISDKEIEWQDFPEKLENFNIRY